MWHAYMAEDFDADFWDYKSPTWGGKLLDTSRPAPSMTTRQARPSGVSGRSSHMPSLV